VFIGKPCIELAHASRHLVRRVNRNRVAADDKPRTEIRYRCHDRMGEEDTIPPAPVQRWCMQSGNDLHKQLLLLLLL